MKLKELLEATYDVKNISNKLVDILWKEFKSEGGEGFGEFDVTKLFKPYIKNLNPDFKEKIELAFDTSIGNQKLFSTGGEVLMNGDDILISLMIPEKFTREQLNQLMQHEIVHVFDTLKSKSSIVKKPKKYGKTPAGYLRDPTEFNALIHELKDFKKKSEYNKISSKKDFISFLKKRNDHFMNEVASLIKEDFWYNKLLKRLAREKLLPRAINK